MRSLRTKTIEDSIAETDEPGHRLHKTLSALDLTVFGVGVVIGTGIFVLTGKAAGVQAGPAVALSFVIAGLTCALAALCYAEFASTVPVAGSAYTFSYATLGELVAWIIGWDLILELALGASTVAVGWSQYFADVMGQIGVTIPESLYSEAPTLGSPNVIAGIIVLVLTGVICLGIKISARLNAVIAAIKIAVVLFVIIAGAFYIKAENYSPFIPPSGSPTAEGAEAAPSLLQDLGFSAGTFGVAGIFTAAALVFFAFSASTSSPRPPKRRATRSGTCHAGSWAHWRSAPCCTCWSRSSLSAWCATTRSALRLRSPRRSGRSAGPDLRP